MPRPKKEGAPEPKRRSRTGCWPCKARKVKCGEEKPGCLNCERTGEECDYSIRLNWGGRTRNKADSFQVDSRSGTSSPSTIVFPTPEELTGHRTPSPQSHKRSSRHIRSRSSNSHHLGRDRSPVVDPDLRPSFHSHSRSQNGIADDLTRLPDIHSTLPVGLAQSMSSNVPRSNVTSAPADFRGFTFRPPPPAEYPSPSASALPSPNFSGDLPTNDSPAAMLPPFRTMPGLSSPARGQSASFAEETLSVPDHRPKRIRIGVNGEASPMTGSPLLLEQSFDVPDTRRSPNAAMLNAYSPFNGAPLTPGSSVASDEQLRGSAKVAAHQLPPSTANQSNQDPPDLRRLSVQSLLAEDRDIKPWKASQQSKYPLQSVAEETTTYGYDLGLPDLDTPRNDDLGAILPYSPPARRESVLSYLNANGEDEWDSSPFNPFSSQSKVIAFEPGGYYANPVAIKIPFSLEPLPPKLVENKMNLLYFHHFLNHTARILVPHDCSDNPFRSVLPEMALQDEDLLNLLLAYSASHRARLLHHPEPANRIAVYAKDVFPKLRHAVTTNEPTSISTLATAIMLASLEILSPGAFGFGIPWRTHLSIARQMIVARGGPDAISRADKVSYFLIRWFAFLDIIGSLSGRQRDLPLSTYYWMNDFCDSQIDCLLGFHSNCVGYLARVSYLVNTVERERIDEMGNVQESWQPSPAIVQQAEELKREIHQAREQVWKPCPYGTNENEHEAGWDALEIAATNDMFHWAALIHIDRRVLNLPLENAEVQYAVKEIVGALYKIRGGSSAEANILFPLFTAGVHAVDPYQRERVMSRLAVVETFGMTHMTKAKTLMQEVWNTGKPWESLVSDEFVG
ncbi:uncharacterized protein PV09_05596 [Verruconis gallopava]|uniref:Zn(2)-C6 fungal-type domain-containing protein n=1 Tax=Verruconis gallopava TaxID=253628 RepID=A0A0D2AW53_9PEZI|nr:uncharacterized protein PV09_05596 [Verruconis gallopava]KIW03389.1 hypothetical protein PV09_05596 [Verruconis gallopava]